MTETAEAALDLVEAVISSFRQLRILGGRLHRHGVPMMGERGVLLELARSGPRTVPAMARTRATSRQHVQVIVDRLIAEGKARRRTNPVNRRSSLIALTRAGHAEVRRIEARERALIKALGPRLDPTELRQAAATLRAFIAAVAAQVASSGDDDR